MLQGRPWIECEKMHSAMEFRRGAAPQPPGDIIPATWDLRRKSPKGNPKMSKISWAYLSVCAGECGAAGRRWQTNNKITWERVAVPPARPNFFTCWGGDDDFSHTGRFFQDAEECRVATLRPAGRRTQFAWINELPAAAGAAGKLFCSGHPCFFSRFLLLRAPAWGVFIK